MSNSAREIENRISDLKEAIGKLLWKFEIELPEVTLEVDYRTRRIDVTRLWDEGRTFVSARYHPRVVVRLGDEQ